VLAPSTREREAVTLKPFFDEMRALGWVEGSTVVYDYAYGDDRHQDDGPRRRRAGRAKAGRHLRAAVPGRRRPLAARRARYRSCSRPPRILSGAGS
jgi:hypothetical protein